MNELEKERFNKKDRIMEMYDTGKYTQKALAEELGISRDCVSQVTQISNIKHRVKKSPSNPNNLRDGEKVNMCISADNLSFLDKATFKE